MRKRFAGSAAKYLLLALLPVATLAYAQWETPWGNASARPVIDCLGNPAKAPDYSRDSIGFVHRPLDEQFCVISTQDRNLLLLRAELVIVVAARYAAASIERYSDKRDEMAIRVIPKINNAMAALNELRGRLQMAGGASDGSGQLADRSYWDVYRAELIMRSAELIAAATEPTRIEIAGLFTASVDLAFAEKTFGLLKSAAINELYANAYRDGFIRQLRGIGSDDKVSPQDFQAIADLLREPRGGCQRLEAMARDSAITCRIPSFSVAAPPSAAQAR